MENTDQLIGRYKAINDEAIQNRKLFDEFIKQKSYIVSKLKESGMSKSNLGRKLGISRQLVDYYLSRNKGGDTTK